MKLKVYTVYDSKTEAYIQPFYMQAKGQAIRSFTELVQDEKHAFGKHPEDYTIFELGDYDDQTSKFDLYDTPVSLGVGHEFIKN